MITYTLNAAGYAETWNCKRIIHSPGSSSYTQEYYGTLTYQNEYLQKASAHLGSATIEHLYFCTWKDGNLMEAGEQGDDDSSRIEYGDLDNRYNVDFNYLFANTVSVSNLTGMWVDIKLSGYFGKRSSKLRVKEIEVDAAHGDEYYTYEYEHSSGLIYKMAITHFDKTDNAVSRMDCKITYTDKK